MRPFFSVIIPSFNRSSLTLEAIEAAITQTYSNYEIIVVDDGSSDGTPQAVAHRFGDTVTLVSKPNGGVSTARNVGASLARGEYIAYLDSDDLWLPDKLELFYEAIQSSNIKEPALYFSDFRRFEMTTNSFYPLSNTELYPRIFKHFTRGHGDLYTATPLETFKCVINDYPFFPSTFVLSRRIHDHIRWDPLVKFSEDFNFVCKVCELFPVVYLDKKLTTVRMHTSNKSANKPAKRASHFATLSAMKAQSNDPAKVKEIRIATGRKHLVAATDSVHGKEWLAAVRHAFLCILNLDYLANVGRNLVGSQLALTTRTKPNSAT